MTEKLNKFEKELDELIERGYYLKDALAHELRPELIKKKYSDAYGEDQLKGEIKKLPNFKQEYQGWYSIALSVIEFVLPNRIDDFISFYQYNGTRKKLDIYNYRIKDHLLGLTAKYNEGDKKLERDDGGPAIFQFNQQLVILDASRELLDNELINIKSVTQADLFSSEIESAHALADGKHLRAAGTIGGVVLESHLKQICDKRKIIFRKKKLGISDLNNALRGNNVIEIHQWRNIQSLADIRNICTHKKNREPTMDEVKDLLSGIEKVIKRIH